MFVADSLALMSTFLQLSSFYYCLVMHIILLHQLYEHKAMMSRVLMDLAYTLHTVALAHHRMSAPFTHHNIQKQNDFILI